METFKRGPGWITNPKETKRLHSYWTKGEGAAKIKWGAPNDFYRCRQHLSKYIGPRYVDQTCAQWHKDALGYWPAEHDGPKHTAGLESFVNIDIGKTLTASIKPVMKPPREWFTDPGFTAKTPISVTQSGRFFGHIATWDQCHTGYGEDMCTLAPRNNTDYSYFRLGSVLCDDDKEVFVGKITMNTGHASADLNYENTIGHYDHTGFVAAYVNVGEDKFGIWCSGWVSPSLTEEQIVTLRGATISGDWRAVRGNLELVAALAVNVPGFPVPRTSLAASGGKQTSLVAAGIVVPSETLDLGEIITRGIEEYERRKSEGERLTVAREAVSKYALELKMEQLADTIARDFK